MSGVEVAGLVLACLPLVIQGIESYHEGLDPVKSFLGWERELPIMIRQLRDQHVHYHQTTRILLMPITTDFELDEMLSGNQRLWKDKAMEARLQEKLQEAYPAYQSTIADIERITKSIAKKLDLERATELSRNDLEALLLANAKKDNGTFEFRKRVKFGINKKTIKALLKELNFCNKQLERFTSKSEKTETIRRSMKPIFANRLQRIQMYATGLHETLSGCFSCACKSSHTTNLRLDHRDGLFSARKAGPAAKTCFNVSFTTISDDQKSSWTWQTAEIVVQDEDDNEDYPESNRRVTKTVSFGNHNPAAPYSQEDPTLARAPSLQEVKDLCASIQSLYDSSSCIGFLYTKSKLHGAYPVQAVTKPRSSGFVTLEELLDQPPLVNGRPAKLNMKERHSLALTLASSTLQLNATPWFPSEHWGVKDIMFHRTRTGYRLVDVDSPYMASKRPKTTPNTNGQGQPRIFRSKNTVLLALAITLLELSFNMSVEKWLEREHPTEKFICNPLTLSAIAYEWAEEEQGNLSAAYFNAVSHCLRCFSDPSASLSDPDFLQAAVEFIVLPLQDELHQFLGKNET